MKFAIIDAANLFNRAHHVCAGDAFTKAGMALHIVFNSLKKVFREHDIDHIVVAGEGRSWRYDFYPQYKAKRVLARKLLNAKEQEEQDVFREVLDDLMTYLSERTRVTVLQSRGCEGDDFIARWVQLHPQDSHVIVSGDSDNIQLLAPNVSIYDGVSERLITRDGVFDSKGRPMAFRVDTSTGKVKVEGAIEDLAKKQNADAKAVLREARASEAKAEKAYRDVQKASGDSPHAELLAKSLTAAKLETLKAESACNKSYEWEAEEDWPAKALFLKIIRGDVGDGIFSANPGVRYKGSKNAVGIEDAWADRHEKGYHWNNFMLKRWNKLVETPEGPSEKEVRVLDEFACNERLIDLTLQPDEIKEMMDRVIVDAVQKEPVGSIGIHFARFCAKHDLKRLGGDAADHAAYLGASYVGGRK